MMFKYMMKKKLAKLGTKEAGQRETTIKRHASEVIETETQK